MDGYHRPDQSKPLPSAIHEMQRILLNAGNARRAAIERMERMLVLETESQEQASRLATAQAEYPPEQALVEAIQATLNDVGVSIVMGDQLSKVWPASGPDASSYRLSLIRDFAARHGWEAFVMNEGQMAMFRVKEEDRGNG